MKHLLKIFTFAFVVLLLIPFTPSSDHSFSSILAAKIGYSFPNNNYPPEGAYVTPRGVTVIWPNGILMKNMIQYGINPVDAPPNSGESKDYVCTGNVSLELSFDQGGTWSTFSTLGSNTFHLAHLKDSLSYNIHSGEVYAMDLAGGSLPPGVIIRESPVQPSTGQVMWSPDGARYRCDSFFDIYFEISTDGGASFWPPNGSISFKAVSFYEESASAIVPSTKFPPHGKYIQAQSDVVTFPAGIRLNNFILRDLFHQGPLPDVTQVYSVTAQSDYSLSLDGGATWSINHSLVSISLSVDKIADSSGVILYETEISGMQFTAGSGVRFRESPTKISTGKIIIDSISSGYMISSFFDIYAEVSLDGGASWSPGDNFLNIGLTYPPAYPFLTNMMMPSTGYKTGAGDEISFASSYKIRSLILDNFTSSFAPPAMGGTSTNIFNGTANFDLSFDGGLGWSDITAPASWQVRTYHQDDDGTAEFYEIEVLQLNITGGDLAPGVIIRESPTLKSSGRHDIVPDLVNYDISSFFDIYTEISTDAGGSFMPSANYISCALIPPCPTISISPESVADGRINDDYLQELYASGGTPPYNFTITGGNLPEGIYLSPEGSIYGIPTAPGYSTFSIEVTDSNGCTASAGYWMAVMPAGQQTYSDQFPQTGRYLQQAGDVVSYATGVAFRKFVVRDLSHIGEPPALFATQAYNFGATADFEFSPDGGTTWTAYHSLPVSMQVNINHYKDEGGTGHYLTEVLQFNISSIAGVLMLRESPTLASRSKIIMSQSPDGRWRVDSFFDIFTETSADGGGSWYPGLDKMMLNFVQPADARFASTNYFPVDGEFKSNPAEPVVFTNGMMIRNILHSRFTQSFPPPPPSGSQINSFGGSVDFELSADNGLTWNSITAPTSDAAQIVHGSSDLNSEYFDTEMLQFNVSGGTIPGGLLIRESPTRASTGRFDFLAVSEGEYRLCSFFDIFFEVSVDGGMSWSTALNPVYLKLRSTPVILGTEAASGWNLLSVPLLVDDYRTGTLYPTAKSPAYKFEGTYVVEETLRNCVGYWLKFSYSQTIDFLGYENVLDTVDVQSGWNMIGSLSVPLAVADIASVPGGIVTSEFFKYENGYAVADTLSPGFGYWVKVNQTGKLVLQRSTQGRMIMEKIQIVHSDQKPPLPPFEDRGNTANVDTKKYGLGQNYPNPFNPVTDIEYHVADGGYVSLIVFDLLGRGVATLVSEVKQAGSYVLTWDASDFPNGVYFCRMQSGGFVETKKLFLIK